MSAYHRIPVLTYNNTVAWRKKMRAILADLGVNQHIEPDATKPQPDNPSEITHWKAGDAKARVQIILSLSDADITTIVGDKMTARELWTELIYYYPQLDPDLDLRNHAESAFEQAPMRMRPDTSIDRQFGILNQLRECIDNQDFFGSKMPDFDFNLQLHECLQRSGALSSPWGPEDSEGLKSRALQDTTDKFVQFIRSQDARVRQRELDRAKRKPQQDDMYRRLVRRQAHRDALGSTVTSGSS